jgi:phosphate starvation-inducible membrane PsiE
VGSAVHKYLVVCVYYETESVRLSVTSHMSETSILMLYDGCLLLEVKFWVLNLLLYESAQVGGFPPVRKALRSENVL